MIKRYTEFGVRLKKERKEAGYKTQADFAKGFVFQDGTRMSFASIQQYEQGRTMPEDWKVIELCKAFGCDVAYLKGEIDQKTHDIKYICDTTGLSERAVINLIEAKEGNCGFDINIVNTFLETVSGQKFFESMERVFDSYKQIVGELNSIPAEIDAAVSSEFSSIELNVPQKKLIDMRHEWLAVLYEFSLVCTDFFEPERKDLTGKIDDLELRIKKERARS